MAYATGARQFDLIISGASFAGLTLAKALTASLGPELQIAVVDRAAGGAIGHADSRASALSASSRHVLDAIGVWASVADAAQAVTTIEITDSELQAGVRPVLLTYENLVGPATEPASHILPNAVLLDALHETVAKAGNVTLLFGAEVTGLAATKAGATVQLADGRAITASLVVAAEGRRSVLREAAGIKLVGWRYPQSGIVVMIAHERPHNGVAVQHFLPGGPFAILPLPGNRSCITWSEYADEARRLLALDDAGFLSELEWRLGGRLGALRLDGPRRSWPLEMHLARRYMAERLALIGDAAHGVHPIAGQGINLALRDVAALTEVVVEAARLGLDIASADVLARYERWRRFDATMSTFAFDGLNRLFSNDWTLLRAAREMGLGLVDRLPGLKKLLVQEAAGLSGELPRLLKGVLV